MPIFMDVKDHPEWPMFVQAYKNRDMGELKRLANIFNSRGFNDAELTKALGELRTADGE